MFQPATFQKVLLLLRKVDVGKSTGSDGIPGYILKHCALELTPSLLRLINMSLSRGYVPQIWKTAHVCPLFKSGDATNAANYRPVSLLPIAYKVLERVVQVRLLQFVQHNKLLPPEQFAYRSGHSTEDALVYAVDRYLSARDDRLNTGIVFVDLSKAFDKVLHQ